MKKRIAVALVLLIGSASAALAQDAGTMTFAAASKSKFINLPSLPECLTVAVQRGDPSKGPSVLLLKFKAGCIVPWHWHTAAENLMVVSGTGKAEMKDGQPLTVHPGDYVYLPAKSIHQFAAVSAVTMFDLPDGAFDIHYVDNAGKEIPFSDAIKRIMKVKPAAGPTTAVPQ